MPANLGHNVGWALGLASQGPAAGGACSNLASTAAARAAATGGLCVRGRVGVVWLDSLSASNFARLKNQQTNA